MVLNQRKVACPLQVSRDTLPQVEESKHFEVSLICEGKMEREIVRLISAVFANDVIIYLDLPVNLFPFLWSYTLGKDQWDEIVDTSGQMRFLCRVVGSSLWTGGFLGEMLNPFVANWEETPGKTKDMLKGLGQGKSGYLC